MQLLELPKARENPSDKSWLVFVLCLIGWENGGSILDQLQSDWKLLSTEQN